MNRRTLLLAAVTGCALIFPASAFADTARPHPLYTDTAGDARNAFGLNVPSADLLTQDITADATTLTFTTRVAGARRYLAASDHYVVNLQADGASVTSYADDTSATGTATLVVQFLGLDTEQILVSGTETVDPITHTITASYSLADVNAAEQRTSPDRGVPPTVFSPSTVIAGSDAYVIVGSNANAAPIDRAGGIPGGYTLGG